jgi:hypothetical protein
VYVLPSTVEIANKGGVSLVVRLDGLLLGNQLVVAFGRHVDGGEGYAECAEDEQAPRGCAECPRGVEVPAGPESGVVFENKGLRLDRLERW